MTHQTQESPRRPWFRRRRPVTAVALAASFAVVSGGLGTWALARPATAVMHEEGASATRFAGLAFDACAAPTRSTMQAWLESPYRAIGIYISGEQRACDQRELDADWITDVAEMGWKFIPIDVGLQAPCADRTRHPMSRDLDKAERQGRSAANQALKNAARLGILPGSAIYSDIESFSSRDADCADAVRSYLTGWTHKLHGNGYLSGVYGNLQSAVRKLSDSHTDERFARPDAVWNAQWDSRPNLADWSGVEDHHWANGQRIKQYLGDHYETWGGRRIHIDSNALDAPVATVAHPYPVTATGPVTVYDGPSALGVVKATVNPGQSLDAVCQIGTPTGRWAKLHDGGYVPNAILAGGGDKPLLPPCSVPFQVRTDGAQIRTGPATEYQESSVLPAGALAWLQCETPALALGQPGYWASLAGGGWVSGALLARPRTFQRSIAVPLCDLPDAPPAPVPLPVP